MCIFITGEGLFCPPTAQPWISLWGFFSTWKFNLRVFFQDSHFCVFLEMQTHTALQCGLEESQLAGKESLIYFILN